MALAIGSHHMAPLASLSSLAPSGLQLPDVLPLVLVNRSFSMTTSVDYASFFQGWGHPSRHTPPMAGHRTTQLVPTQSSTFAASCYTSQYS